MQVTGEPHPNPMRRFVPIALAATVIAMSAPVLLGAGESGAPSPAHTGQPEGEGRTATIILHDGQVITGTLVEETDEAITLNINGIRTTIEIGKIRESYIQAPIEDRYRSVRASIDDDDAEQLIQLARWLMKNERNDLALKELNGVLEKEPFNETAKNLKTVAEQNIRLQEARKNDNRGNNANKLRDRVQRDAPDFPMLTDSDINTIRVWEVDEESPPRLRIDPGTLESAFELYSDHKLVPETAAGREAILRSSAKEQLNFLFELQARQLYPEIQVLDDPKSIKIFRDHVHRTWLRNACATTKCHGGAEAGRFRLIRTTSNTPQVYYTNMWILENYRTDEGLPLINFQDPAESVLLKMALPRTETDQPHPDVLGWRFVFRSPEDRNFRRTVEWIESMWTPRPDYDIDYDPPTAMEPEAEADRGSR
ncbi:MAG: hypothetical protein Phyf2KO_19960 [Phycisphaerales bacterium]